MRRFVTGLCAVAFVAVVALLLASTATARTPKVNVCHRPPDMPGKFKIISVGASAVANHLAHGDNVVGPEVCDGVDNDCDGSIDEDYPDLGDACSVNYGTCTAYGVVACDATGGSECNAVDPRTAEVCDDGNDNDCDGDVDCDDSDCAEQNCGFEQVCVGTSCTHCGDPADPCCAGDTCNFADTTCNTGQCQQCGDFGEPCCAGNTCNDPQNLLCNPSSMTCTLIG